MVRDTVTRYSIPANPQNAWSPSCAGPSAVRSRIMGARRMRVLFTVILLAAAGSAMAQNAVPRTSAGKPNLNGIWQVLNEANWNLEAHIATQGPVETLGAIGAVAPGTGVVVGARIPYLPAAR